MGKAGKRGAADHPVVTAGEQPLRSTIAVITGVYTCLTLLNPALGGSEWGSRYLLITVPALVIFAWLGVERLLPAPAGMGRRQWQPGARPLLFGMSLVLIVSVMLQWHGFLIVNWMHESNHKLAEAIRQAPDQVVISTSWWAPLDAAPVYPEKMILYAGDEQHPFPPVLQQMKKQKVGTYTLVGFSPYDLSNFAQQAGYLPIAGTIQYPAFRLCLSRYGKP